MARKSPGANPVQAAIRLAQLEARIANDPRNGAATTTGPNGETFARWYAETAAKVAEDQA